MIQTGSSPQELSQLWQQVFGDEQAYLDVYCKHLYKPEQVLFWHEQGKAVAMVSYLPFVVVAGERNLKCGYIHAVATHPLHRGNGLAGILMDQLEKQLQEKGMDGAVLVPAEESLFGYYKKHGYQTQFYTQTQQVERSHYPSVLPQLQQTSLSVLQESRNKYFSKRGAFAQWGQEQLKFFDEECLLLGGKVLATGDNYMVCYPQQTEGETILSIKEISCEESLSAPMIQGALAHFHLKRGLVRYAATSSQKATPFAMARWFHKEAEQVFAQSPQKQLPYISLVMD